MADHVERLEEAHEVLHAIEAKGLTWADACFGTSTILSAIRNQERQRIREALARKWHARQSLTWSEIDSALDSLTKEGDSDGE